MENLNFVVETERFRIGYLPELSFKRLKLIPTGNSIKFSQVAPASRKIELLLEMYSMEIQVMILSSQLAYSANVHVLQTENKQGWISEQLFRNSDLSTYRHFSPLSHPFGHVRRGTQHFSQSFVKRRTIQGRKTFNFLQAKQEYGYIKVWIH